MSTNEEDFPCRDAVALVTDYLEHALSPEQRAVVDRHLAICEGCETYFEQIRRTITLTAILRQQDIPVPVLRAATAALRELRRA